MNLKNLFLFFLLAVIVKNDIVGISILEKNDYFYKDDIRKVIGMFDVKEFNRNIIIVDNDETNNICSSLENIIGHCNEEFIFEMNEKYSLIVFYFVGAMKEEYRMENELLIEDIKTVFNDKIDIIYNDEEMIIAKVKEVIKDEKGVIDSIKNYSRTKRNININIIDQDFYYRNNDNSLPIPEPPKERNKQIEEWINEVSENSQRDFLDGLTNPIFTRLSTSLDVYRAVYYINQTIIDQGFEPFIYSYNVNEDRYPPVICYDPIIGKEEKDTYIIVSGHYDDRSTNITDPKQRAPGANDDGSGVAAVTEIGRILSNIDDASFKYSIRLCYFSGEEQGRKGSIEYSKYLSEQNTKILAMMQSDMIAYKPVDDKPALDMAYRFVTEDLLYYCNNITTLYFPTLTLGLTDSCCTDSQSFFVEGYNSIAYNEKGGYLVDPYYHSTGDTIEREGYSFEQLKIITQTVFASALTLAEPTSNSK
eukprot:TRINITY_DN13693_c0_g1_i1.p1 TRINITY_DN13693_c0_g1~~TRINITY_DN13693_c0_g1_i1.p1  ORF type:complete len:476 (-),score=121.09 TRINITY_DN13693_c0_g1_i1:102-1529(-)